MFSLKDKVAVITGGSRGIGKAIASKMAECGANVIIVYTSNDETASKTVEEISKFGHETVAYKCDVSQDSQVKELVSKLNSKFKKIDILVNNAGIRDDKLAFNMDYNCFNKIIQTNLIGSFNMIHHLYLNFVKNNYGRIINISSTVGINGNAGQANYAASKAGIIGLSKSIAKELGRKNVTCNIIAPGFIETDMTNNLKNKQEILHNIPLNKFGTVNDVASAAVFLASDEAQYITGTIVNVDGGLIL